MADKRAWEFVVRYATLNRADFFGDGAMRGDASWGATEYLDRGSRGRDKDARRRAKSKSLPVWEYQVRANPLP